MNNGSECSSPICNEAQLVELIRVARCQPDTSEWNRKAADSFFLNLCQCASNVGDVLIHIAIQENYAYGVRLNAAFALKSLLKSAEWLRGSHFMDKGTATSMLLDYVMRYSGEESDRSGALCETLFHSLASIFVAEYPAPEWLHFFQAVLFPMFVAGMPNALFLMRCLSTLAHHNLALWYWLAAEEIPRWIEQCEGAEATVAPALIFCNIVELMKNRPSPSLVATEEKKRGKTFLSSEKMNSFAARQLEGAVRLAPAHASDSKYLETCSTLLEVVQRLSLDIETAKHVFQAGVFFLSSYQALYLVQGDTVQPDIHSLIDNSLECLLQALQTFPSATQAGIMEVLPMLLSFMTNRGESLDTEESEALLMGLLVGDEVVPLGCAGGDTPSLASAVWELFLEANYDRVDEVVQVLFEFMVRFLREGNHVADENIALLRALRSVARVCEDRGASAFRGLSDDLFQAFLSKFLDQFHPQANHYLLILFIDAFLLSLRGLSDDKGRRGVFLTTISSAYDRWIAASATPQQEPDSVRSALLYAAGDLLAQDKTLCERNHARDAIYILWIQRCLDTTSIREDVGAALSAAGCVSIACTKIMSAVEPYSADGFVFLMGRLCHYCHSRQIASAVVAYWKGLFAHPQLDDFWCSVFQRSSQLVLHSHQAAGAQQRPLLIRSVAQLGLEVAKKCIAAPQTVCGRCGPFLLQEGLAVVANSILLGDPFEEGLDEPTSRTMALCMATITRLVGVETPEATAAVVAAFRATNTLLVRGAAGDGCAYSCQTLSILAGHLVSHLARAPALLNAEQVLPDVVTAVFAKDLFEQRKGVNFVGCAVLVSFCLLQQPHRLGEVALRGGAAPEWTSALGWLCSLAGWSDLPSVKFFIASCIAILGSLPAWTEEAKDAVVQPVMGLFFCAFPSLLVKWTSSTPCVKPCSILGAVTLALHFIRRRYHKTSKVRLFDADADPFTQFMGHCPATATIGNPVLEEMAALAFLTKTEDVIEKASQLLQRLGQMGYTGLVEETDTWVAHHTEKL